MLLQEVDPVPGPLRVGIDLAGAVLLLEAEQLRVFQVVLAGKRSEQSVVQDVARESVAGVRAPGGRQAGREGVRKALRLPMAGEEGLGKLDAFLAASVLPCRVSGVVEPGRKQQDVCFRAIELIALCDLAAVVDQPAAALEPAVDEGNVRARVAEQLEHVPSGKLDDFRIRFAHPRFPSAARAAPPSRRMGRRDNEALAEPTRAPAITSVVQ